ncbi:uncharacterized protein SCHCODRAFT_02594037 [Schizophyllum commune H4-8]|nr:uncharacterized protein SCHCODRAFT_02594037 [Schizophyllum commune H4-8]KAI5885429.1 hypothetical protein SCHCODRAFT_02594037 [Schizophyllum commune H4-8]
MGIPLADITAELYPDDIHCYTKTAVTLGRVCSTWMGVTRGYPLLWTTVDIAPPDMNSLAVLTSCLRYSGSLPLSLELDLSNYRECDQVDAVLKRLMRTVARNAHRWASISMMLYKYTGLLKHLTIAPRGAFTSLERVSIEAYHVGPWQSNPARGLYESFCASPDLHAVCWWSEPIALDAPEFAIANLTHVGLFLNDGTAEILTILRRCNRLQVLQFIFHDSCDQPQGSLGTVHLPHLHTLMLRSIRYDFTWLYKYFLVPRLRRLDVVPRYPQGEAIECMLSQSRASLRMLNWGFPRYWHIDDLVGLLHSDPLRSLRVLRYLARPHCRTVETFEEVARLVPSHVETYTASFYEAESAFRRL